MQLLQKVQTLTDSPEGKTMQVQPKMKTVLCFTRP